MKPRSLAGWMFVAPALAVIGLFFILPVAAGLALSFTDFDLYALADLRNLRFAGLDNYGRVLSLPLFWTALLNTLEFVVLGVPLSIGCVRMRNRDIIELFGLVPAGTVVEIVE